MFAIPIADMLLLVDFFHIQKNVMLAMLLLLLQHGGIEAKALVDAHFGSFRFASFREATFCNSFSKEADRIKKRCAATKSQLIFNFCDILADFSYWLDL